MIINSQARTPEYFGAVARGVGLLENANPYSRGNAARGLPADPRYKKWLNGFYGGELEQRPRSFNKPQVATA